MLQNIIHIDSENQQNLISVQHTITDNICQCFCTKYLSINDNCMYSWFQAQLLLLQVYEKIWNFKLE